VGKHIRGESCSSTSYGEGLRSRVGRPPERACSFTLTHGATYQVKSTQVMDTDLRGELLVHIDTLRVEGTHRVDHPAVTAVQHQVAVEVEQLERTVEFSAAERTVVVAVCAEMTHTPTGANVNTQRRRMRRPPDVCVWRQGQILSDVW
jgi:hypothetical protein